ncbi:hypothetical protein NKI94_30915 [Mesorhizobium australicum]|uniref:hypothetical protein n=1 Tax=Mesorhizobium australicum TaxID=536018 RepID=UPI00333A102F
MLDEIVETRRNTKKARRLLTRLLKNQDLPPKRDVEKMLDRGPHTPQGACV